MTNRWRNLVVESQFATELVRSGISQVCALPMSGDERARVGYDQTYPLNIGLHLYTSGLERLCKLALACHGFVATGEFSNVRNYSHRLSNLLSALEELDTSQLDSLNPHYLSRPSDEFGDDLVEWLERYASGGGRYEILDSLSRDDAHVLTWEKWEEFCSGGAVSEDVEQSISIRNAVGNALTDVCIANDLESAAYPLLEHATKPLHAAAVAVGLAMYRRARWPAEILASVSNYTSQELPILREAVNVLTQTTDNFFAYEIAGVSDREPVIEELINHRDTFVMPDFEEGDDWLEDEPEPEGADAEHAAHDGSEQSGTT